MKLDNSASFTGTVAGMIAQDTIDFGDIVYASIDHGRETRFGFTVAACVAIPHEGAVKEMPGNPHLQPKVSDL